MLPRFLFRVREDALRHPSEKVPEVQCCIWCQWFPSHLHWMRLIHGICLCLVQFLNIGGACPVMLGARQQFYIPFEIAFQKTTNMFSCIGLAEPTWSHSTGLSWQTFFTHKSCCCLLSGVSWMFVDFLWVNTASTRSPIPPQLYMYYPEPMWTHQHEWAYRPVIENKLPCRLCSSSFAFSLLNSWYCIFVLSVMTAYSDGCATASLKSIKILKCIDNVFMLSY